MTLLSFNVEKLKKSKESKAFSDSKELRKLRILTQLEGGSTLITLWGESEGFISRDDPMCTWELKVRGTGCMFQEFGRTKKG